MRGLDKSLRRVRTITNDVATELIHLVNLDLVLSGIPSEGRLRRSSLTAK
jgi:hypothetical protein